MMKIGACFCILAAALAAPAAASDTNREVGYAAGALGYDALIRADFDRAEQQLEARRGVRADDPARLLNLANLHWRTGRLASARALYESVRDHPRSFAVELADGSVRDSREVARIALGRMTQSIAQR